MKDFTRRAKQVVIGAGLFWTLIANQVAHAGTLHLFWSTTGPQQGTPPELVNQTNPSVDTSGGPVVLHLWGLAEPGDRWNKVNINIVCDGNAAVADIVVFNPMVDVNATPTPRWDATSAGIPAMPQVSVSVDGLGGNLIPNSVCTGIANPIPGIDHLADINSQAILLASVEFVGQGNVWLQVGSGLIDRAGGVPGQELVRFGMGDQPIISNDANSSPGTASASADAQLYLPVIFNGACCLPLGNCIITNPVSCILQFGVFQGIGTNCNNVTCVPTHGACCILNGLICVEVGELLCRLLHGQFQGLGVACDTCTPMGACCLPNGDCEHLSESDCQSQSGAYQGDFTFCIHVHCPRPGACCLPDGSCQEIFETQCTALGGTFQGENVACAAVACLQVDRIDATNKGSVLYFPDIELRWNAASQLVQDVFVQLTNDNNAAVNVQMYFVNGDPPLPAALNDERAHPGWNWIDNQLALTPNQPTYWSVLTGHPAGGGLSPFIVLDPGDPPGRPDPAGSTDRVLRGFIVAFAVNADMHQIKWNHLAGNVTVVNYRDGTAYEYNAWALQCVNPVIPTGAPCGPPGMINLNGFDFGRGFDQLLINFQAANSAAFSNFSQVLANPILVLHPLDIDLRQETGGPITTKAKFDVWNANEVKLSGAERCITCWEKRPLATWSPMANHFTRLTLQTDVGKARIDGEQSQVCNPLVSRATSLIGVLVTRLTFDGGLANADAGVNVLGMGWQSAVIKYDPSGGGSPPTANQAGVIGAGAATAGTATSAARGMRR
jgi:hypothetical protein